MKILKRSVEQTEDGYIYHRNGDVVFIEKSGIGNNWKVQADGLGRVQREIKGVAKILFNTKQKWFDCDFWYYRNSWLDDYGYLNFENLEPGWKLNRGDLACEYQRKISKFQFQGWTGLEPISVLNGYYNSKEYKKKEFKVAMDFIKKHRQRLIAKKFVLNEIFGIVKDKTGAKKIELVGKEWSEAWIPVRIDGKSGILTWQNCD